MIKQATISAIILGLPILCCAQAADWQEVIWREPQVRYLMADMQLGGSIDLYRKYAVEERDPDSREAIRLWDSGARVVNTADFERRWLKEPLGKDGKVMRIVSRKTNRAIRGMEVMLTSDFHVQQGEVRRLIAMLTLGFSKDRLESRREDPNVAEALRRWAAGARAVNAAWFDLDTKNDGRIIYHGTTAPIDGAHVRLNSDVPYPETNVRYFLADIYLGGSREFYEHAARAAHEMGCLEAVARFDAGVSITNLDQLERKKVDGKVLIVKKGTDHRIKGSDVTLSTD